jgi:hypothetical protein
MYDGNGYLKIYEARLLTWGFKIVVGLGTSHNSASIHDDSYYSLTLLPALESEMEKGQPGGGDSQTS